MACTIQMEEPTLTLLLKGEDNRTNIYGVHEGLTSVITSNRDAFGWADRITWNGGTSSACPTFAGVIALVNDALLAKGKPTLGFLNPWLYSDAYKALTDVKGGSSFGCGGIGFPAQEGWDAGKMTSIMLHWTIADVG